MDTPNNLPSYTVLNYQSNSHLTTSNDTPEFRLKSHPYSKVDIPSPMIRAHPQINSSFGNTSAASTNTSQRLLPLISIFEALDANSLTFSIRDAQPPHLRLPGSGMGRHNIMEDLCQMKTARQRLLTLFDRPGWGAETLRGLRNSHRSRGPDESPIEQAKGPSKTQTLKEANLSVSPKFPRNSDRKLLNPRVRYRGESIVRDRIRLFDGGIEFSPTSHNDAWKLSVADIAVAPISPSRYRTTVSPNKQNHFLVSPPKPGHGILAPKISHGYLRPNETTPRPWRPLDTRRWGGVTTPKNNEETPYLRGRPRERYEKSLVSPTPTNAVKKVRIIHQDPKRNISEKVTVQSALRSKERDQGNCKNEIKEGYTCMVPSPYLSARSGYKINSMEVATPWERRVDLESNEVAFLKSVNLLKESKIQDRIKLFSNEGADLKSLGMSLSRMRIQSSPVKLPSHQLYRVDTASTKKVPYRSRSIRSQLQNYSTEVTEVGNSKNPRPYRQLQPVDDQLLEPPTHEAEVRALEPCRSSGVSDKIQRFEAFMRSQVPSNERTIVNKSVKRALSRSIRIQTLPRLPVESAPNDNSDWTRVEKEHIDPECGGQEYGVSMPLAELNSLEKQKEKKTKRNQDGQIAKHKRQCRQERLSRRSRSRSRSVASVFIHEPLGEQGSAGKQSSEFSRSKETKSTREATQGIGITVEIGSNNVSCYGQRGGQDMVQEIWIEGSQGGSSGEEAVVVGTVVAQCELAEPRPMRLAETLRMIRLCRGRFGERNGTWRRKLRGSSEKGTGLAV